MQINFSPAFLAVFLRCPMLHVTCYSLKYKSKEFSLSNFCLASRKLSFIVQWRLLKLQRGPIHRFLESLLFILSVKLSRVEDNWDDFWLLFFYRSGTELNKRQFFFLSCFIFIKIDPEILIPVKFTVSVLPKPQVL